MAFHTIVYSIERLIYYIDGLLRILELLLPFSGTYHYFAADMRAAYLRERQAYH